MLETLTELFAMEYTRNILLRVFAVGSAVSLCAALLGVNLVLKRYSMIGDGLSHVGFAAMAIAYALDAQPMYIALPIVAIAAFFLLRLQENGKTKGDAAIAVISTSALAIGTVIIANSPSLSGELESSLFGNIYSVSVSDVYLGVILSLFVALLYLVFYRRIFAVTFDEQFARATGIRVGLYNTLLALLTSVTVVVGMRLMGALLISALIIFPSLTAMKLFKSFKGVAIASAVISLLGFCVGNLVAAGLDLQPGACTVLVNLAIYLVFSSISAIKSRV